MDINSKIYVAGHGGMVGSAIVRRLRESGYRNIVTRSRTELDLRNQTDVAAFFRNEQPEYVFLAAAKVGGIIANNTYKAEFLYDNLLIAANIIDQSYRWKVKKLANLGSSCIYPKFAPQPITEDALLTGALESTNEPYAIAKIAALKLCRYYREQYGFEALSLMPTNLYGANDNYNLETSHAFAALTRKMFLGKALRERNVSCLRKDLGMAPLGGGLDDLAKNASTFDEIAGLLERTGVTAEYVKVWGSGKARREFLHADDLADALLYFMERYSPAEVGEFVNIGSGRDLPIIELAERIRRAAGYEGELVFDGDKPDGAPRKVLDVTRASSFGWNYKITLEAGISRVVAAYFASRGNV